MAFEDSFVVIVHSKTGRKKIRLLFCGKFMELRWLLKIHLLLLYIQKLKEKN
jgi:hypothetical protein